MGSIKRDDNRAKCVQKIADAAQVIGKECRNTNSFFYKLPIEISKKIASLAYDREINLSEDLKQEIVEENFVPRPNVN